MLPQLNAAAKAWLEQAKADKDKTAGMVTTAEFTPSDALYAGLTYVGELSEPFSPELRKTFGKWLALPVIRGWKYADDREPSNNLYALALPYFADDMAKAVAAHNELNKHRFAA